MSSATLPGPLPLTLDADTSVLPAIAEIRPSTELIVVMTDASGHTKTLDSSAPDPRDRPTGIQFGTQLGSGFYTGGFELSNPIDRDRDDIHLLDDVRFIGASGDIAYEGFVGAMPRSMDDTHSLSITAAGWMSHAADETFTDLYVDRDMSAWGPMSRERRVTLLGLSAAPGEPTTAPDASTGAAGLVLAINSPSSRNVVEALYDAGPGRKASFVYWTVHRTDIPPATAWSFAFYNGANDTVYDNASSQLTGSGTASSAYEPGTAARFVHIYLDNSTVVDTNPHEASFTELAVYGDHGLPRLGDRPYGVAASEVIKDIARRYCPLLNTSGVRDTTYPIAHLVFRDDTKPYDAMLRVNAFHQWLLAVWEDRTLHYGPADLSEWDWEVRHDEVGNTIGLQGDSAQELRNGIKVHFTNVATGAVEALHPDDYSELRDDSIENPANVHGRRMYGDAFTVPWPTTRANALELGRIKLIEDNAVKAPGSFTVRGHIRDRSGQWQPPWKVRAGDRIRLTSSASLSDRPRLVHETNYSHDSRSVTIAVDAPMRVLEAYVDRVQTSLAAHGLL